MEASRPRRRRLPSRSMELSSPPRLHAGPGRERRGLRPGQEPEPTIDTLEALPRRPAQQLDQLVLAVGPGEELRAAAGPDRRQTGEWIVTLHGRGACRPFTGSHQRVAEPEHVAGADRDQQVPVAQSSGGALHVDEPPDRATRAVAVGCRVRRRPRCSPGERPDPPHAPDTRRAPPPRRRRRAPRRSRVEMGLEHRR